MTDNIVLLPEGLFADVMVALALYPLHTTALVACVVVFVLLGRIRT